MELLVIAFAIPKRVRVKLFQITDYADELDPIAILSSSLEAVN